MNNRANFGTSNAGKAMKTKRLLAILTFLALALPAVAFADSGKWHYRPYYSNGKKGCSDGQPYSSNYYWQNDGHNSYYNYSRPTSYWNSGTNLNSAGLWQGVRSGRLSDREVYELRNEQRKLSQEEARYRADGWLSTFERRDLYNDYRSYNQKLQHELNDGEYRRR